MRSSSVNWLSRSSGSSHLNAASLICAVFGARLSVFSATCDIGAAPWLGCKTRTFQARRKHGSRAARVAASPAFGYLRRISNAPVAQLDRALPSEGRGQGFESLRARQFSAIGAD